MKVPMHFARNLVSSHEEYEGNPQNVIFNTKIGKNCLKSPGKEGQPNFFDRISMCMQKVITTFFINEEVL